MPVTAFTSRVKNAGKRRDECGDRGVEEKKKLPPPSYIICCTADWCMFVPRWEIFTSEYIFQWDKHASTSTRTTNTGTFGIRSMRAPRILYTYMPSWSRDTYMNAQKVHVCKKKKKKKTTTMQKSRWKQKKLLTNSFVFQSMRGAELCMQKNRNAKKQNHTMQYPWSLRSVCKTINYCQQISTSIETAFMH